MNSSFEQEYREMMNNETPDLWDRIEAGVKASEKSNSVITGIDDLRKNSEVKKEKKLMANYYQIMAVAGVAACFAVLAVGAPAVRQSMHMEKEAMEGRTDADIQLPDDTSSSAVTADTSSSEKESSSVAAAEDKESSSVLKEESSSRSQREVSSSKKEKKPEKKPEKDDSSATGSALNHEEKQPVEENTHITDSTSVVQETSSQAEGSSSQAEKTSKKKKKSSSSTGTDEGVIPDSAIETELPSSDTSKAPEGPDKVELENRPDALSVTDDQTKTETDSSSQKTEEEKKEPVLYTGIVAKVSSKKESEGSIIYTFKVISDENGNFSKNKKIKVQSSEILEKGSSYVIAFSDDGSKTGSSVLYNLIAVSDFEAE